MGWEGVVGCGSIGRIGRTGEDGSGRKVARRVEDGQSFRQSGCSGGVLGIGEAVGKK